MRDQGLTVSGPQVEHGTEKHHGGEGTGLWPAAVSEATGSSEQTQFEIWGLVGDWAGETSWASSKGPLHSVPGKWSSTVWTVRVLSSDRVRRSSFCLRHCPHLDPSRTTLEEKGFGKSQQHCRPRQVQASVKAIVKRKEGALDTRATVNQLAFKKVGSAGQRKVRNKKWERDPPGLYLMLLCRKRCHLQRLRVQKREWFCERTTACWVCSLEGLPKRITQQSVILQVQGV